MDFLRRSIHIKDNHHLPQISTPIPTVSKPTSAIQPPKKVIRALDDHRPQAPNELGFSKGDFFHVVNEIDKGSGWYEANNPMTGARGLVPKDKFEVFSKSNAAIRVSQAGRKSQGPKSPPPTSAARQPAVFYAVVQHDFVAERADELDAKTGDHISVVAQSNFEWFVAKPISRLGRPGLIPVSFVAIHDPHSGQPLDEQQVKALMERGEVPGVEEWKKSILEYKATSISLGVLDDEMRSPSANGAQATSLPPAMPSNRVTPPEAVSVPVQPQLTGLPPGTLLSAEVLSWHFEMDEYWFRIHALYQPDDSTGSGSLPPAKQLVLFRVYNDFYDFQVKLLKTFPIEAGQKPAGPGEESRRMLPFMPGPSPNVDDKITQLRKEELDAYLSQFCGLWQYRAEYILRHELIRDFFTPRAGDSEEDVDPAYRLLEERGMMSVNGVYVDELQEPFEQMSLQTQPDRRSEDALYEEPHGSSSRHVNGGFRPNLTSPAPEPDQYYQNYNQREPSYPRAQSPYTNPPPGPHIPGHKRTGSSLSTQDNTVPFKSGAPDEYSQMVNYKSLRQPEDDSPRSYTSQHQHVQPNSAVDSMDSNRSRSRSISNVNSPPISANNPNPAFMKIKIFDRLTQELIAIRVSPRVTHNQLMDKVRARLGDDVRNLAYRNSVSNTFLGLEDDEALRQWLEGTDKHVLYAD